MSPPDPNHCDDALRWQSMSKSELEREYSPSSAVGGNYQPFIEEYTTRSAASRKRCTTIKTLRYGGLESNLIEFAPPMESSAEGSAQQSDNPSPLLVFIHGGYWQEGSRSDSLFGADYFAELGIAYAAIGYSLAPNVSLSHIVNECRQAIAMLSNSAESLRIDTSKIVIAGSSAGAHLAAMCCVPETSLIATAPSPVAGLVLMSGVFDLQPLVSTYVNDEVGMSVQESVDLSPSQQCLSALPSTIISWGENETDEFKRQSRAFAKALQERKVKTSAFESPGRNHFDIVHNLADNRSEIGRRVMLMLIN